MDPTIITDGKIIASSLSGNHRPSLSDRFLTSFYRRLAFSTDILCRAILTRISTASLDLDAVLNLVIEYPKKCKNEHVLLHAPYPNEFVSIGNFWIQTISRDGTALSGFVLWYHPRDRNEVFAWLEKTFQPIENFTHSYHPGTTVVPLMSKGSAEIRSASIRPVTPSEYVAANYVPPLYTPPPSYDTSKSSDDIEL